MRGMYLATLMPFLISLGGIMLDYWITTIGLGMGFVEVNPEYHPLKALAILWSAITMLTVASPKTRVWRIGINALALLPYLGAINNTLVILGIFPGLQI